MNIFCTHCGQKYDVDDSFVGKSFQCENCNNVCSVPGLQVKQPESSNSKIGVAAIVLLIIATVIHIFSLYLIAAPVYLACFIVSIVALCKGKFVQGLIGLIGSIIIPILIGVIFLTVVAAMARMS